jgi:hypothetical protein
MEETEGGREEVALASSSIQPDEASAVLPVFWTQRAHFGPPPRLDHAMAYDAARQRVVLFGGLNIQGTLGDTWVWDGAYWTQVSETGPSPRQFHAMAYDAVRQQVVLFGGSIGGVTRLEDTWVWDGVNWTQVAEKGPPRRRNHAMAWDDVRGLVILFGGEGQDRLLQDTWGWDGAAWSQREEDGPAARFRHAMAYNAVSTNVVLFGGRAANQVLDDTWEWNGTVWRQVAEFGAPGVLDAAMTQDGRGSMLFGGVPRLGLNDEVPGFDNTWEWDGRFWTELQHFGPPGRAAHAMVFDAARRRVVLFGGDRSSGVPTADSLLGDTWECPAREAMLIPLAVEPPQECQAATRSSGSV